MVAATIAALAVLAAGAPAGNEASAEAATAGRAARIEAAVRAVLRRERVPGAIVGVWQPGEEPLVKGFGVRRIGGAPMTPDLHLRIGSETKTFTGTAILQLVDEGKVGLDDPVGDYVKGVPSGRKITIRELGEMRAGLVDFAATGWSEAFLANPHRQWRPRQLLAYSFREPPLSAPGQRFEYSNTNFVLLGLVVEAASGESAQAYVTRHILDPLQLPQTSFAPDASIPSAHADGYTDQTANGALADTVGWNYSWAGAAASMVSTVGDLKTWAQAVATGSLLRPATQRQRLRFLPAAGGLAGAGYGFALFDVNGWIGHNGSIPGYESLTVYLPAEAATMVVLVNSNVNPPSGHQLSTLIAHAITVVISPGHVFSLGGG